jgi:ABC-type nitrate/sulfonate/bicarbonate transport system ATPase subunit
MDDLGRSIPSSVPGCRTNCLLQAAGKTIVLVTHDIDEAIKADRVAILDGRHAAVRRTCRDPASPPRLRRGFLIGPRASSGC